MTIPTELTAAAELYNVPTWSGLTSVVTKLRHVTTKAAPRENSTMPRISTARDGAVATMTRPRAETALLTWERRRSLRVLGRWRVLVRREETSGIRRRKFARVIRPRREIRRLDCYLIHISVLGFGGIEKEGNMRTLAILQWNRFEVYCSSRVVDCLLMLVINIAKRQTATPGRSMMNPIELWRSRILSLIY